MTNESKQAVKMALLSCHRFRSNEVHLWLSVMAYALRILVVSRCACSCGASSVGCCVGEWGEGA